MRPQDAAFRNPSTGEFMGNHLTHIPGAATAQSCNTCHPGSSAYDSAHRKGRIKISPKLNSSPGITVYNNSTSSFVQTANPILGKCSSVNCHFETLTPVWGSSVFTPPSDCNKCHDAPPNDGSHPAATGSGKKHGDYLGLDTRSCSKCHADHLAAGKKFAHATSVGKRPLSVRFTTPPNSGGIYAGYSGNLLNILPSQRAANKRNGTCTTVYCHSNAVGGAPFMTARWGSTTALPCYGCHRGRTSDSNAANCNSVLGIWSSAKGKCLPDLTMESNGHHRLVGPQWIRKYPCYFCHNNTVDASGAIKNYTTHVNGLKDIAMAPRWNIIGRPVASYNPVTKVCDNVYCHSDGTSDPEDVRPFAWTAPKTECNSCHGHPSGSCSSATCHDGRIDGVTGKLWPVKTGWPAGSEWMGAMPMFPNQGAATARANSHPRHTQASFGCDNCHADTITNGTCTTCHVDGIPPGGMGEVSHINAAFHVDGTKSVKLKDGGDYSTLTKTCSGTKCHAGGTPPVWGGAITTADTCLACHRTTGADRDTYQAFSGYSQAKINITEFYASGHGRYSTSGRYPVSNNPAANFPGNPCWYCHDNNVLHRDAANPFRLRMHRQYENRFEKECVYCHMEGKDYECRACHDMAESLAPQLTNITSARYVYNHRPYASPSTQTCVTVCHTNNATIHKTGDNKFWNTTEKQDIKNQYLMMGVCLQCHDDDSGGQCTSCHTAPVGDPLKYSIGFDPGIAGSRFIKPKKARASAAHFGYKHYREYVADGKWRGGKFCWDCHDPHGDSNIYMIHDKVATTTDGTFGIPQTRAGVSFTRKLSGLDYARISAPYNGICNVCHSSGSKHYTSISGDGHNASRVCTTCHEHRFADSHANQQSCSTAGCHDNRKPVPKHTAFGLPRDCTKCHAGTIGLRMDVMSQLRSNSHHIQRTTGEIKNTDCYQCHWEANSNGLINIQYHEGYNYQNFSTSKNKKVDLVIYSAGFRPAVYKNNSSAVQFLASNMGSGAERAEVSKVTSHCLACHSDKNNNTEPFGDCKTPRQYAWDRSSVAARYSQTGTTTWGKYAATTNAAQKNITKALSAHGNAPANQGGWSTQNGNDGVLPNTRGGANAVQCFDCHSSHGSKVVGTTTSYVTFNGSKNGGNLKETQAGKGGYAMTYKAAANTDTSSANPYSAGAGQCFDCHLTRNSGTTPWGYFSTFGAISSVMGYRDTARFAKAPTPVVKRTPYKTPQIKSGHLKASTSLDIAAMGTIDGLCTPCHDPHGVTLSLGADQAYAVPLLKGTWMTSPYKEDLAIDGATSGTLGSGGCAGNHNPTAAPYVYTDQKTFGAGVTIAETDTKFAGLCVTCHTKANLTAGADKAKAWKSRDRIHQSVKGWGVNDMHSYSCSKCHQPHVSGLPRLMGTNCLNVSHRGRSPSLGVAGYNASYGSFPKGKGFIGTNCHPDGAWPNNLWNTKTPW